MRTSSLFLLSVCAVASMALYGCAKLQDTPPESVAPGIGVHPAGWPDPVSPNFHGRSIATNSWDMRGCKSCHGANYAGGSVGVSCLTCHAKTNGPENCTTCHGGVNPAPPKDLAGDTTISAAGVGAHQIHLVGPRTLASVQIKCGDCHHVPSAVYVAGHLDSPQPAEVVISDSLANISTGGITPSPTFDAATRRCSNTYCHGNWRLSKAGTTNSFVFVDTATAMFGNKYAPVWNGGSPEAACGTCHGSNTTQGPSIVPAGHQFSQIVGCAACHIGVLDNTGKIIDQTKHMNGKVNVFNLEYDFR